MNTLAIANGYGGVDVRKGLSKSYVHVRGQRLQPLCRKLGVKWAIALVGFKKSKFGYSAITDGVIVSAKSAPKLLQAISERAERATRQPEQTPEQRKAAKQKRQERDVTAFAREIQRDYPSCPKEEALDIAAHACKIGSGRVGRSRIADDPVRAAVIAHIRHTYTDYDEILDESYDIGYDREDREGAKQEARNLVWPQILAKLSEWEVLSTEGIAPGQNGADS